jgi:hypothetical protein
MNHIEYQTGLIVGGWHGRYATSYMIGYAMSEGYSPSDMTKQSLIAALNAYDNGDEHAMREAGFSGDGHDDRDYYADEALDWLNGQVPDGYVYHWSDGEFFLSQDCGTDGCDNDDCICQVT